MTVKVFLERKGTEIEIDETKLKTPKEILNYLEESVNSVIITLNSEVVLEDQPLKDGDDLKILSVVSGG